MNTTRSGFLTATGATTTGAHAQDDGHDHAHQTVPSDLALRVRALESLRVSPSGIVLSRRVFMYSPLVIMT